MTWFIRRIATSVVLAWIVATGVFLSLHLVPGDPAEILLTADDGVPPNATVVAELRRELGLDRPILEQYGDFLLGLVQGDLGRSLLDNYPVASEVATRLPRTLELVFVATAVSLLIGIPLGTWTALRAGGRVDRFLVVAAPALLATPIFVISTLFILVFAQWLNWTPAGGYVAFSADPGRHLALLAMPAGAIALSFSIVIYRMTRNSVLDVLSKDFVRTAHAKGVPRRRLRSRHIVRAAITPVLSIVGMEMGSMIGGTVITEYIFNWPGIATPLMQGITTRDYPMVSGIALTVAVVFLAINLITDILYALIDPRVRLK